MGATARVAVAAAIASVALGAAGCGGGDAPALSGPDVATVPAATPEPGGPKIDVVTVGAVEAPVVAGAPAITAGARAVAVGLSRAGRDCPVTVERSDPALVSLRWACTDGTVASGTWSVSTGRALSLADVLDGAWPAYLSSVARVQLVAGGASTAAATAATPATPGAYRSWYLTPDALTVTFPLPPNHPSVAFPLATLAPFLPAGGPVQA